MFHVTYEVVTPESSEHGYVHANGGRDPLSRIEDASHYAMDLRTALRHCSPQWDCGRWFEQESQIEDYSTDERVSYSLHPPRAITSSSYARLARLLKVRR
jgi:hypothetical protein